MTDWKEERCSKEPAQLEYVSPDTMIERRNITEVDHDKTETMDAYKEFVCESRFISKSEHAMLKSIAEISTEDEVNKALDNYTNALIEQGVI